jgi:hypothetical protein
VTRPCDEAVATLLEAAHRRRPSRGPDGEEIWLSGRRLGLPNEKLDVF